MIRAFNNKLALVGIFGILALWILDGAGIVKVREVAYGATIVTWALLWNFFYRKSPKPPQAN